MKQWMWMGLWMGCRSTTETKVETVEDVEIIDADGDGFSVEDGDCDDRDALTSPIAIELCDGFDNNCDGQIDEGVRQTFFEDKDGDGFGNSDATLEACEVPDGYVAGGNDCDDDRANTYPSAPEQCDEIDNDCDGDIDEELQTEWWLDADGDGFGTAEYFAEGCLAEAGFAANPNDCDDANPDANPTMVEVCDEIDNNCDGQVDEDLTTTAYLDADGDGFGDDAFIVEICELVAGYVLVGGDCDDIDSYAYPGFYELCDDVDNNCDGQVDEGVGSTGTLWYWDADGDGYGDSANWIMDCNPDSGYVPFQGDCDDTDANNHPNNIEVCDGQDNDCDTLVDDGDTGVVGRLTWYQDNDFDGMGSSVSTQACIQPSGYVAGTGDCNDGNNIIYTGAPEICDSLDNDCDGFVDDNDADVVGQQTWYQDGDGDGNGSTVSQISCFAPSGYVPTTGDCNDGNTVIYSGAPELCDTLDNNCNGLTDDADALVVGQGMYYPDADLDGYGDQNGGGLHCFQPVGTVTNGGDCDDGDSSEKPGVVWYADSDGDGYGNPASSSTCARNASTDILNNTDCDDTDAQEHPGVLWFVDSDGDGFGSAGSVSTCARANSSDVLNNTDCNDANAFLTPADNDGDGWSTCSGDCDDGDASLNQTDSDGDGYSSCDDDCNDSAASASPVGVEDCVDGLDNDCDGIVDNGPLGTSNCPASSCGDVPSTGMAYVNQGLGSGVAQYYCENDTDGGGWTLAYWNSFGHHDTTSAVNRSALGDLDTHAKLDDTEIKGIATAGFREVMIKGHNSSTIYIQRYSSSAWSAFSSRGWRNQAYESMSPNGNFVSGCNGHYNNRGVSSYSDAHGAPCPTVYQGSAKYFVTWHTYYYANGVGGEYGVYVR